MANEGFSTPVLDNERKERVHAARDLHKGSHPHSAAVLAKVLAKRPCEHFIYRLLFPLE